MRDYSIFCIVLIFCLILLIHFLDSAIKQIIMPYVYQLNGEKRKTFVSSFLVIELKIIKQLQLYVIVNISSYLELRCTSIGQPRDVCDFIVI